MNDFYLNKSIVILQSLTFTNRDGLEETIDLSINSLARYAVNGEPSAPVFFTYRNYGPSGDDGINLVYGPTKSIIVQPIQVDDFDGNKRWNSELPSLYVRTSNRANLKIRKSLYVFDYINYSPFIINYAGNAPKKSEDKEKKDRKHNNFINILYSKKFF